MVRMSSPNLWVLLLTQFPCCRVRVASLHRACAIHPSPSQSASPAGKCKSACVFFTAPAAASTRSVRLLKPQCPSDDRTRKTQRVGNTQKLSFFLLAKREREGKNPHAHTNTHIKMLSVIPPSSMAMQQHHQQQKLGYGGGQTYAPQQSTPTDLFSTSAVVATAGFSNVKPAGSSQKLFQQQWGNGTWNMGYSQQQQMASNMMVRTRQVERQPQQPQQQQPRRPSNPAPAVTTPTPAASASTAPRGLRPGRPGTDYFKPLFVDCSIEYDLPNVPKVPKNGAAEPILMIHPGYAQKQKLQQQQQQRQQQQPKLFLTAPSAVPQQKPPCNCCRHSPEILRRQQQQQQQRMALMQQQQQMLIREKQKTMMKKQAVKRSYQDTTNNNNADMIMNGNSSNISQQGEEPA